MYKKIFKSVCHAAKLLGNQRFVLNACNKSRAAWNIAKQELGISKQENDFPDLVCNNVLSKHGQTISDSLNFKFANISKEINTTPCKNNALAYMEGGYFGLGELTSFTLLPVTVAEVKKTILSLKNTKAVGWDEISVRLLKDTVDIICKPLCLIINQSFKDGYFPDQLKFAEIIPVFKKGDRHISDNYRPISILPSISKIFEKLVCKQIQFYFENNKIFYSTQYGFRSGKNTTDAIAKLVESIVRALDESQRSSAVFCDLSRAFDCVSHDILLSKLSKYKFSNVALSWIRSYLENRKQRVIIRKDSKKYTSGWHDVSTGIPQGSILGPVLFIIYTNDLNYNIKADLISYADDTSAILRAHTVKELKILTQYTLQELSNWFHANGLKLNIDKTQIVKFQTHRSLDKDFFIENSNFKIHSLPHVKFLGLMLDSNLNWKHYIYSLSKKLNSACFQMSIVRKTLDLKTRLMIYYAYFYSLIQYGIELWGSSCEINNIFKIQKRIIRLITFSHSRVSCKPLLIELGLLSIPSLYIFRCIMYVLKNCESSSFAQNVHCYNTRHKGDFQYPIHHLGLFEKTTIYMGKKFFNNLPAALKEPTDIKMFRAKLRDFLITKAFYSINQFLLNE